MTRLQPASVVISRPFRHVLAILLLAGAAVAGDASATTYHIVELPLPALSPNGAAADINAVGDIVGFATDRNFERYAAVVWRAPDYSLRVLPQGAATGGTTAARINDRGIIIGGGYFPDAAPYSDPVMWKRDGTLVRLKKWSGAQNGVVFNGAALGINNRSIIVGAVTGKRASRPAIWLGPQTVHWLGSAGGNPVSGEANAVNDSGIVVGTDRGGPEIGRAVRWTSNGGMQELGDLPGGSNDSFASDVNESNQIVGTGSSEHGRRAVMWDPDGSVLDLGEVSGGENLSYSATNINNLGDVVGSTYDYETGVSQGFLWTAGTGMMRIVDLVDPADPLHPLIEAGASIYAYEINDAGIIVGVLETVDPQDSTLSQVPIALMPQP